MNMLLHGIRDSADVIKVMGLEIGRLSQWAYSHKSTKTENPLAGVRDAAEHEARGRARGHSTCCGSGTEGPEAKEGRGLQKQEQPRPRASKEMEISALQLCGSALCQLPE